MLICIWNVEMHAILLISQLFQLPSTILRCYQHFPSSLYACVTLYQSLKCHFINYMKIRDLLTSLKFVHLAVLLQVSSSSVGGPSFFSFILIIVVVSIENKIENENPIKLFLFATTC